MWVATGAAIPNIGKQGIVDVSERFPHPSPPGTACFQPLRLSALGAPVERVSIHCVPTLLISQVVADGLDSVVAADRPTWRNDNQVAKASSEDGLERAEEHGRETSVDQPRPRPQGVRAGLELVTNSEIHR